MKIRSGLLILMLLVLTLAACSAERLDDPPVQAQHDATSTPIPTAAVAAKPTYRVQRGDVSDVFSFTGRWQPRDQMALSFSVGGTVGTGQRAKGRRRHGRAASGNV